MHRHFKRIPWEVEQTLVEAFWIWIFYRKLKTARIFFCLKIPEDKDRLFTPWTIDLMMLGVHTLKEPEAQTSVPVEP